MILRYAVFLDGFIKTLIGGIFKWTLIIVGVSAGIGILIYFIGRAFAAVKDSVSGINKTPNVIFLTANHYKDPSFRKNPDTTYVSICTQKNRIDSSVNYHTGAKPGDEVGEDVFAYACSYAIGRAAECDASSLSDMCGYGAMFMTLLENFCSGETKYRPGYSSKTPVHGYQHDVLARQSNYFAMKKCIESLKNEYETKVAGALFAGEEVKKIVGVKNLYSWLNQAGREELSIIVNNICERAEEILGSGQINEAASLVLAAYSLVLSVYTRKRRYTAYSGLISSMLAEIRKRGLLTEEVYARKTAMVDSLDRTKNVITAEDAMSALDQVRTEAGIAFSSFVPKEIHSNTIRDDKSIAGTVPAEAREEKKVIRNGSPYGNLLSLLASAEEALAGNACLDAALHGRHFLEVVLKAYCEAAGVDRSQMGLMEQIDYFKNNGMLQEIECSHLHAIRMVSNKGAHYDTTLTKAETEGMIRHMKAEIKIFGIG